MCVGGGFNEGVESVPQTESACVLERESKKERKREKLEREREL